MTAHRAACPVELALTPTPHTLRACSLACSCVCDSPKWRVMTQDDIMRLKSSKVSAVDLEAPPASRSVGKPRRSPRPATSPRTSTTVVNGTASLAGSCAGSGSTGTCKRPSPRPSTEHCPGGTTPEGAADAGSAEEAAVVALRKQLALTRERFLAS